jgi:hypothetical protein
MLRQKHFWFAAILVTLVCVSAATEAQQSTQPVRQRTHADQKAKEPPQPQQQPATETRGTDQNPVAVKVISAQDAKPESPEDRERRIAHELNEQGLTDYTRILANATIALIFIAALQAGLFLWQLGYMRVGLHDAKVAADAAKDGAKAAADSVDIAKLSMISGDRAYVHYNGCRWISHRQDNNGPVFWRVRPVWINSGNTPTRDLRLFAAYELLDSPLGDDFPFIPPEHDRIPAMISPKGLAESGSRDIDGAEFVAIREGRKHLYVWGVARYRDVFPNTVEHVTKFCVEATNISGNPLIPWDAQRNIFDIAFATYKRHNCSDEDCKDER